MLGKLIKHQTKSVYRILLLVHAAVLLLAVIGSVFTFFVDAENFAASVLTGMIGIMYILTLMFAFFSTQYVMVSRFYKSMYTDEGYLTHTLPVKTWQHLLSNTIVYFAAIVLDIVILTLSILILARPSGILDLGADLMPAMRMASAALGISVPVLILCIFGIIIISLLYIIGMFYMSLSVGSLFPSHKIMASVIVYVILYIAMQTIGLITIAVAPWTHAMVNADPNNVLQMTSGIIQFVKGLLGFDIILMGGGTIIYFAVTHFIMSRKLNLQ